MENSRRELHSKDGKVIAVLQPHPHKSNTYLLKHTMFESDDEYIFMDIEDCETMEIAEWKATLIINVMKLLML